MGISIYYTAYREHGLSADERTRIEEILTEENGSLFADLSRRLRDWKQQGIVPADMMGAEELCEGLDIHAPGFIEPGIVLKGASKISHSKCGPDPCTCNWSTTRHPHLAGSGRRSPAPLGKCMSITII